MTLGGTDPFKKYFDGVMLVLNDEERTECLGEEVNEVVLNSATQSATDNSEAGLKAAMRGDYMAACVHHAEAVAVGGTIPFKKYFDGVVLVLDDELVSECLAEVRDRGAARVQ